MCISPVDKDGDGDDDDKDKADHHGNHLMHCKCTCVGGRRNEATVSTEKHNARFKSEQGDIVFCELRLFVRILF